MQNNTALSQKEVDNAIFYSSLQHFFKYAFVFAGLKFNGLLKNILLVPGIKV